MTRKELLKQLSLLLPHLPALELRLLLSGARAALGQEKADKVLGPSSTP